VAGWQTVYCDSIDSLAWHVSLVGIAILIGFGLQKGLQLAEIQLFPESSMRIFKGFPLFPLCMIGGLFLQNNGEIYNLITSDFEINSSVSGNIASVNTGLIYRCCNTSDIMCSQKNVLTGGVVGLNKASGMIIYSSNTGTVSASGESSQAGGIAYGNYGIIAGCFNSASQVFSEGSKLSMSGGISSFNYGTISDCYNNADIYSNDISGGITATNTGNIINAYVTSNYIFGKTFGGITANGNNSIIINTYYPNDRISKGIANGTSEGIIGVYSQDMLKKETFEGFDFENMWIWVDGYCPLIGDALL
jgi:hypothetical protein